jgi:hypothetical protein
MLLKIKNLGFCSQINQRATGVHRHIVIKFGLVNLTSVGAGNSDTNGNFVFDQIGQKIIGTVSGRCVFGHIPGRIRPHDTVFNKKNVHLMPL